MSTLSQLTIPVKSGSTTSEQTFDLGGGASWTELTTSVAANATSIAFTDAAITSSATYDLYTSAATFYKSVSISGTTITYTIKPVSSAMTAKLRIS